MTIIFARQTITKDSPESNFFIQFECDRELSLAAYSVESIRLTQSMGSPFHFLSLEIVDVAGDFLSNKMIEGDFTFTLIVGRNEFDIDSYKMKLSRIEAVSIGAGSVSDIMYSVNFVTSNWQETFSSRKNRAWVDAPYSDVVQDLSEESNFKKSYITESNTPTPITIQPYWTNFEMMKWIKKRCVSDESESGGYEMGLLSDGTFVFATLDDIVRNKPFNPEPEPSRFLMGVKTPQTDGVNLIDRIKVSQDYMMRMQQGSSGTSHSYYDYMNKTYVPKQEVTYKDLPDAQLSKFAFISETQLTTAKTFYTHSSEEAENLSKILISKNTNRIQSLDLLLSGYIPNDLFEVIEVIIQTTPDMQEVPYNEFLSGKYIITSKEISVSGNTMSTVFGVSRQGMNGDNLEGLIRSQTGKMT